MKLLQLNQHCQSIFHFTKELSDGLKGFMDKSKTLTIDKKLQLFSFLLNDFSYKHSTLADNLENLHNFIYSIRNTNKRIVVESEEDKELLETQKRLMTQSYINLSDYYAKLLEFEKSIFYKECFIESKDFFRNLFGIKLRLRNLTIMIKCDNELFN